MTHRIRDELSGELGDSSESGPAFDDTGIETEVGRNFVENWTQQFKSKWHIIILPKFQEWLKMLV
jgi:hypothetical protein